MFEVLFEHRFPLYLEAEMSSVGIGRHISMLDCNRIQTRMATEVAQKLQASEYTGTNK